MSGLSWDVYYFTTSWVKAGRVVYDTLILRELHRLFPQPSSHHLYIRYNISGEISWKVEER